MKAKFLKEAAWAPLHLELASLQVVWTRQVKDVATWLRLVKDANELRVDKPTIDLHLILHKLDEGLPKLDALGHVLGHESLGVANGFTMKFLAAGPFASVLADSHELLFGHV